MNELKELTTKDIETINKVAKGIFDHYKLGQKTVNKVFRCNYDKNARFSSLKEKSQAYKRSLKLLNNEDNIKEYFNNNDTEGLSKDQFIHYLGLIKEI